MKKRAFFILSAVVMVSIFSMPVKSLSAAEAVPAELAELKAQIKVLEEKHQKEIAELRRRISELESKQAAEPVESLEPSVAPPGFLAERVQLHGSVDLTYFDYQNRGYRNGDSTFEVYEAYLAAVTEIADDVRLYLEPRYEHGGDTIELRQGYLDWRFIDPMTLRAGKFYMPIGSYQKWYYNSLRKLVEYHYSMRLVNVAPWEDNGFELHGEFPLGGTRMNYAIAVVNGLDSDYAQNTSGSVRNARQNRDNNNSKTVGGRLGWIPWKGLELGFSWNTGEYDNTNRLRLDFYDVDVHYELGDFDLRSEFVESVAEQAVGPDIKAAGFYVEGAYRILKNYRGLNYVELVAAVDTVRSDQPLNDRFRLLSGQEAWKTSFGLNISPRKNFLIKAEYLFVNEDSPSIANDAYLLQLVVDF